MNGYLHSCGGPAWTARISSPESFVKDEIGEGKTLDEIPVDLSRDLSQYIFLNRWVRPSEADKIMT